MTAVVALVAVASLDPLMPRYAGAACNLVPASERVFPSTLGEVLSPFGQPGQAVTIRRETAVFGRLSARNTIALRFHPPGGPETVVGGIAAAAPAAGTPCTPAHCTADLCTCVTFTFPSTDAHVVGPDDGVMLAGPVEIEVRTDGAVVGRIDRLFLPGTRIRDDVFPSFTALPPSNPFVSFSQGPGGALQAAPDDQGNLLVPFDFAALAPPGVLQTRFVDLTVPGLGALTQQQLDAFTADGRKLPPLLRYLGGDEVIGSVDAPASVIRIGSALPGAGLSAIESKGPVMIPGVSGMVDPRRRADASSLLTVGGVAVYETRECGVEDPPGDCLDLNGDGDEFDYFVYALRFTDPEPVPMLVDTIDVRTFPAYANHLQDPLYRFTASEHLVAFEIIEGSITDLDGNGSTTDILRSGAFDLAHGMPIPQAAGSNRLELAGSLLAFTVTEDPDTGRDALYTYDAMDGAPVAEPVASALQPRYFVSRPKDVFAAAAISTLGINNPLRLAVAGSRVAFLVDEALQGVDLNANEQVDDALLLFDARSGVVENLFRTTSAPTINLSGRRLAFQDADFAVQLIDLDGPHHSSVPICDPGFLLPGISDDLVPCIVPEFAFSQDLSGDGDTDDIVLWAAAPGLELVIQTSIAVADLATASVSIPVLRGPLLAIGVDEVVQGFDLNGDGQLGGPPPFPLFDTEPLVLLLLNADRLSGQRALLNSRLQAALSAPAAMQFIDGGFSFLTADLRRTILRDLDGDGAFEELLEDAESGQFRLDDNCPTVANPDQLDGDGDGIGDLCEPPPAACGNGIIEESEACDGDVDEACPGRCQENCTCGPVPPECGNDLVETGEPCDGGPSEVCRSGCTPTCECACEAPTASTVKLSGRKRVGVRGAATVSLAQYAGESVRVALRAGDEEIAAQTIGALAPKGRKGRVFRFVARDRDSAVRKLTVRPDQVDARVALRAARWVDAAEAATVSGLRITIGTRCFDVPL